MPTIVHFDLPADDLMRAKDFYSNLFGWKFFAPPGYGDFYLIETTDLAGNTGIGGGMGKRGTPDQRIMNYIGVSSIEAYAKKIEELGGTMVLPKTVVPKFGYLALCKDTEGNTFGVWQDDPEAGSSCQ